MSPERPAFAVLWQPPATGVSPREFVDSEVAACVREGNFARGRALCTRRVVTDSRNPRVYLDALRVETAAGSAGVAAESPIQWIAWALANGVVIEWAQQLDAAELLALLSSGNGLPWALQRAESDRRVVHELMRRRLEKLLLQEDYATALETVTDASFLEDARDEPELERLLIGVLAATVFSYPAEVEALVDAYGIDFEASASGEDEAAPTPLEVLQEARHLAVLAARIEAQVSCPDALRRFIRLSALVSEDERLRLCEQLRSEAASASRAYLDYLDVAVREAQAFGLWLLNRLESCAQASTAADPGAIEERLLRVETSLGRDPLRWAATSVVVLSLLAVVLCYRWLGTPGLLVIGVASLAWPVWKASRAVMYRRNVRAPMARILAEVGGGPASLARQLGSASLGRLAKMLDRLRADLPLAVFGAIGQLPSLAPSAASPPR
ncbi:MAG: hypothetical protein OEZ06_18515 [Myxococcales bacterium]|nr:hypothetical protein [Myxococcales bacterium]